MEPDVSKPFPANGKIVVRYGGKTAEALLELPAPSTRDGAAELPAVVWLTAGLLATDTFALQVCSWSSLLHWYNMHSMALSQSICDRVHTGLWYDVAAAVEAEKD